MHLKKLLLAAANSEVFIIGSFLYSIISLGMWIFGLIAKLPAPMPTFTWYEVAFNFLMFGVIYVLQRGLRDLQQRLNLKRLADTYVSHYRAQVLYQGGTQYATPGMQATDLNTRLQAEADAVVNAILNDHRELTRKQVQEALADHYGW